MNITDIALRHRPANPDKFEFDDEVSLIFPTMAERSIPNYKQFHTLHAEIVCRWFGRNHISMLDVGASHGEFFSAIKAFYRDNTTGEPTPIMHMIAMDTSAKMCEIMREKHRDVHVLQGSLTDMTFMARVRDLYKFDVVNATYVLQFIEPAKQLEALAILGSMVKPGGILILGQKEETRGNLGVMLHEQYVRWRMNNGYTEEEVRAKTRALVGSMWPMHQPELIAALELDFDEVHETTRMFMFSTLIAYKHK